MRLQLALGPTCLCCDRDGDVCATGRAPHLVSRRTLGGKHVDTLCLAKGLLHPGGRICILVFHDFGAGHYCSSGKIFVNSKALRDGGEGRDLLQPMQKSLIQSTDIG